MTGLLKSIKGIVPKSPWQILVLTMMLLFLKNVIEQIARAQLEEEKDCGENGREREKAT